MTRLSVIHATMAGLVLAATAVAAPVPKSLKPKPSLDGRWEAVLMHAGGRDILPGNTTVWDISGEKITRCHKQPDGTIQAVHTITLTIPDATMPDEIDYGSGKGEGLFRARMKLTADELVIRFADQNSPRPADLTEGTDGYYYRFKRVEAK